MVQHIIDAERIFCYRALNFTRKDNHELPGFVENEFSTFSKSYKRLKLEFLDEVLTVQRSSYLLFESFDEEQLDQLGKANGNSIYVKAIVFFFKQKTAYEM